VGLFLLDEAGEWAVLQAAEGRTAENVLRGYRVPVNGDSIISQSIARAQTRMATGAQELPGARSVAVLPLRSRDRVFGAITLASDQPDAFDQDTVAVLETVADQVAVALDNAQLFAQSRAALETARRAYGELSHQAWAELLHARMDLSMRKSQSGTFVVSGARAPHAQAALQTGQVVVEQEAKTNLAAPVKVREQVVGVIDARKPGGSAEWTTEEIKLLATLAEQLGVALDSARLYQDTQRRAAREQLTREITDKMRRAMDMDELLQTTLKEMTAALGAPGAFVQLLPPSESDSGQEQAGARVREA